MQSSHLDSSRGSFHQSSAPSIGRGHGRGIGCFTCGQFGHYAANCLQRGSHYSGQRPAPSEPIVGDSGRSHRVFAAVDHRQAEHQGMVIETSGAIRGIDFSILFDSVSTDSFISPFVVERCGLVAVKQGIGWQVELASGAKMNTNTLI